MAIVPKIRNRNPIKTQRSMVLISFLAIILLIGKAEGKKATLPYRTVNLATPTWQSMSTLCYEIGMKKGFFQAEGIRVETLFLKSSLGIAGLITGDIDYLASAGSTIRAAAVGVPVRIVMVITDRLPHYLFAQPRYQSVKELKGKVVAVASLGGSPEYSARAILKYHGLDPDKDVTLLPVGVGNVTFQALVAGSVDAAIVWGLQPHEATKRGFKELMTARDVPGFIVPSLGLGVAEKKIKKNPEEIKKMIKALFRSIIFIKERREETLDFMAREWGIHKSLAADQYEREIKNYSIDGKVTEGPLMGEIKLERERGLITSKEEISPSKLVDFSILEQVKKELGLL